MGGRSPLPALAGPALRGPGDDDDDDERPIGDPDPDDGDWDDDDDFDDDEDPLQVAPSAPCLNLVQSAACGAPPQAR